MAACAEREESERGRRGRGGGGGAPVPALRANAGPTAWSVRRGRGGPCPPVLLHSQHAPAVERRKGGVGCVRGAPKTGRRVSKIGRPPHSLAEKKRQRPPPPFPLSTPCTKPPAPPRCVRSVTSRPPSPSRVTQAANLRGPPTQKRPLPHRAAPSLCSHPPEGTLDGRGRAALSKQQGGPLIFGLKINHGPRRPPRAGRPARRLLQRDGGAQVHHQLAHD